MTNIRPFRLPAKGALRRSFGVSLMAALVLVAASGCDTDRMTVTRPGDTVRLSDSWTMVVPDGWEGDFLKHGRATVVQTGGVYSCIALSEPLRDHETVISVQVITEDLWHGRIQYALTRESARTLRDDPKRKSVLTEREAWWALEEYMVSPAGEHLWISVSRLDRGPWKPDVDEGELGDHLLELLQLSSDGGPQIGGEG